MSQSANRIPTQAEYEHREARMHAKHLDQIAKAPLADRRLARDRWARAIAEDPDLVGERAEWIFNGSYGYGACQAGKRIQTGTGRNKPAALGQLVAALEWMCPAPMAAAAWKQLTAKQQKAVNAALTKALKTEPAA